MNLPSWNELSPKISKFQTDLDDFLQNKVNSFKDNNPLKDKAIRSIIQVLPPPFNSFVETIYNTSKNSDPVKRLEEIRQLVIMIQNNGENSYRNIVNAGGDVIGLNVDGNGNIIAKNITIVVNEVKDFFGFEVISKGYFSGISDEAIEAIFKEEWTSGFELSKESIFHGKEFRREKFLSVIKKSLEKNRSLLLLGEAGTSKTTLLNEVLSDYYKDHYNDNFIILYSAGITEPKDPNKLIETIRHLLNAGNKILVVVDNVHEKKLAPIFYVIRRLQFFYSTSTADSDIRFILAARQPEYQNLIVKERFGIDTQYFNALQLLNSRKEFTMEVPPFTSDEVEQFIRQYSSYLPVTRKYKSLEQNKDEIYDDTGGHPVLVRFHVTGYGIRSDVESRYKNYLSVNVNGNQRPDYNKIITSFVCSIYHISTISIDDNLLKNMKINTNEDGTLVERNLYWFANELDRAVLYRDESNGRWKTLHVRWALELFKFIFDNYKEDRNLIEKFKECLSASINFMTLNESEDNMLYIYNTIYNTIPSNKSIGFEIIKEVANIPERYSTSSKAELYSLVICPSIADQISQEEAVKCYDKVITDLDPSYADAYYNKGISLGKLGNLGDPARYEEAIQCFDKIITDIDPSYPDAHYNKGVCLTKLGDLGDHAKYEEAIECYNKVKTDHPNYTNAQYNKGLVLRNLGDLGDHAKYEEAIQCYDKIIDTLDPSYADAYNYKGLVLRRMGHLDAPARYEEAIQCFDKIIDDLDASYIDAYNNKGLVLGDLGNLGDPVKYEEAIQYFDKIITDLDPNYANAYYNKGFVLKKLGDLGDPVRYEEAIQCFDKIITDINPIDAVTYFNKGVCLTKLGDLGDPVRYEEAIQCFDKIITDLDPNYSDAYYNKGITLGKLGNLGDPARYEEAIQCFDKIITDLDPNYSDAYHNKAIAYYNRSHSFIMNKEIKKSLDDLEKAIENDPSLAENARNDWNFASLENNRRFKSIIRKRNI